MTGDELLRVEPDGSRVRHADLLEISPYGWSEITVDGRGNAYVNSLNFDFATFTEVLASGTAPGKIALVTADGKAREVADGLAFPNGMAVTPDNRTLIVAESFAARLTAFDIAADGSLSNRRVWADVTGDGICIDAVRLDELVQTVGTEPLGDDHEQRPAVVATEHACVARTIDLDAVEHLAALADAQGAVTSVCADGAAPDGTLLARSSPPVWRCRTRAGHRHCHLPVRSDRTARSLSGRGPCPVCSILQRRGRRGADHLRSNGPG